MKRNTRRAIAGIFILAFLITTPLLLAYSVGYRFDWKKQRIESVGALFIDVAPRDVRVELNNQLIDDSLPLKMVNLLPNTYQINISKDGFYSWQKTLDVHSQLTTFADQVELFKQAEPNLIEADTYQQSITSPSGLQAISIVEKNNAQELWHHNAAGEKQLLYRLSDSSEEPRMRWSYDSDRILFEHKDLAIILTPATPETIVYLDDLGVKDLENINWDRRNSNVLYTRSGSDIYQLNIANITTDKITQLPSGNITDYLVKNGNIFFIQEDSDKKQFALYRKSLSEKQIPSFVMTMNHSNLKLKDLQEDTFALKDYQNKETHLFRSSELEMSYTTYPSTDLLLASNGQKIVFHNDFELWTTEKDSDGLFSENFLLTRYSKGINATLWHDNTEYLYFTAGKELHVIELDGRDRRNQYTLATMEDDILSLVRSDDATSLTIITKAGKYTLDTTENIPFIQTLLTN